MGDAGQSGPAQEPAQGSASTQTVGPRVTVDGEIVSEFRTVIEGVPGHLVTDSATFQVTRFYKWANGDYDLGDGRNRTIAGGQSVIEAQYTRGKGLELRFSNYALWLPDSCLRPSWKP